MTQWIVDNRLWILLGFGTVFGWFWLSQFKEKLNIKEWLIPIISILHTTVMVWAVRVFAFLEAGGKSGGMSLYGSIFFLPVAYFVCAKIFKRDVVMIFDVLAINAI